MKVRKVRIFAAEKCRKVTKTNIWVLNVTWNICAAVSELLPCGTNIITESLTTLQPTRSFSSSVSLSLFLFSVSLSFWKSSPPQQRHGAGCFSFCVPPAGICQDVPLCYRHLVMSQGVTTDCVFLAAGIENLYERAQCVRKILLGVPRATLVVMRYLFAFLNQWVSTHTKLSP